MERLEELLERWQDDALDADGQKELADLLEDAGVRRSFYSYLRENASIREVSASIRATDEEEFESSQYESCLQVASPHASTRRAPRVRVRRTARWVGAVVAAAALVLLTLSVVTMSPDGRPWWRYAFGPPVVARIELASGSVQVASAGTDRWRGVSGGSPLELGDRVRTARRGVRIRLVSGAALYVSNHTELGLLMDESGNGVELADGRICLENSDGRRLYARTPQARVVDIGTIFSVNVSPDGTAVSVATGAVDLHTDAGTVRVKAGFEAAVRDRGEKPAKARRALRLSARLSWAMSLGLGPYLGEARTVSFQDGMTPDKTYAGTRDAQVASRAGAAAARGTITISGRTDGDAEHDSSGLFAWDTSSIPRGSDVLSVSLTFTVDSHARGQSFKIYALARDWDEQGVSWARASSSRKWRGVGASGATDRHPDAVGGLAPWDTGSYAVTLGLDAVAAVQRWVDDPRTNRGILIEGDRQTAGVVLLSREHGQAWRRPKLTVEFAPTLGR